MTLVLLDTMWGDGTQAPDWFQINPRNHSGRRLHAILGDRPFLVGNACPQKVAHANAHGKPDPAHVRRIFRHAFVRGWTLRTVVLGGKVAQRTFDAAGMRLFCPTVRIPHPAMRFWTKEAQALAAERIAAIEHGDFALELLKGSPPLWRLHES